MKKVFNTIDTTYRKYNGEYVTVLRPLTEEEADIEEVGPMYRIRTQDGTTLDAFEDELS